MYPAPQATTDLTASRSFWGVVRIANPLCFPPNSSQTYSLGCPSFFMPAGSKRLTSGVSIFTNDVPLHICGSFVQQTFCLAAERTFSRIFEPVEASHIQPSL